VPRTVLCWSGGKDSAWTLHELRAQGVEISALLTSLNEANGRVAMHAIRRELLEAQAEAAAIPLWTVPLPWPCRNGDYETRMEAAYRRAAGAGVTHIAFGDLFLEEIRGYRETNLQGSGLTPIFPLWHRPTVVLAREMIAGGLRARLTCVDTRALPRDFAGREFDARLLQDLPREADPCGENGEFHSFVYDGPFFRHPIPVRAGELHEDGDCVFADLMVAEVS
jgi:uncharacterized protein (TIGR00290 family)